MPRLQPIRLPRSGPAALADGELLASFLEEGQPERIAAALAREGGLHRLWNREPRELAGLLGCSETAALRLALAAELGRRCLYRPASLAPPFTGGADVHAWLAPRLAHRREECFWALHLDAKGRLLREQEVSRGTLTASLVHPREVFAPALLYRAAAVVVAHNHPSGDPEPSPEDRATTRRLQRAGRLLGVELLDHVVLGAGRYTSFMERGWL